MTAATVAAWQSEAEQAADYLADRHTAALSAGRRLLKENMWASVMFQGKWKNTHTHKHTLGSRACCDSVNL